MATLTKARIVEDLLAKNLFTKTESAQIIESLFELLKQSLASGLPVGDRAFVFIVEATSNDEVDQLLRNIPMWGSLDWEVTPLQTFAGRADMERAAIKGLKRASN